MLKLVDILREMGEGTTVLPYRASIKHPGSYYVFTFNTATHIYEIVGQLYDRLNGTKTLELVFGTQDASGNLEYPITNTGDLFKVMSTVAAIIKEIMKEEGNISVIKYTPVLKKGEIPGTVPQRDKLYRLFIKKADPQAVFDQRRDATYVYLKGNKKSQDSKEPLIPSLRFKK
jgi:hypothetical protein